MPGGAPPGGPMGGWARQAEVRQQDQAADPCPGCRLAAAAASAAAAAAAAPADQSRRSWRSDPRSGSAGFAAP